MSIMSRLIAAILATSATAPLPVTKTFRGATPSRHVRTHSHEIIEGCRQSNKDDNLPRGYPGAKMARKARMRFLAVNHPRGLRANGITV